MIVRNSVILLQVPSAQTGSPTALKQSIGGLLKSLRTQGVTIAHEPLFYDSGNHYPLIQYFSDGDQTGISGYNEGADALYHLFPHIDTLRFGKTTIRPAAIWLSKSWYALDYSADPITYRIHRYLGLNSGNYTDIKKDGDPYHQKAILIKALAGHLRGATKDLSFQMEEYPRVQILRWGESYIEPYKRTKLTCLENLDFTCDLILPIGIGVGKGSALGYGRLERLSP